MPPSTLIDPVAVGRSVFPNRALAATPGITVAAPDLMAPSFPLPAARVADLWAAVVEGQPRTRIVGRGADGLALHATQATAVLGFVDDVHARVLPLGRDQSTIVVLSRSRIGLWDLGVNRARLRTWLADLEARAARWSAGQGPG
jgi:uncharacterized protein (DUF1499 family)